MLRIGWEDIENLRRFDNALKALGGKEMRKVANRAINHAGDRTKTQVIRALTKQTGLKRSTIVRAVKVTRSNWGTLSYSMTARGGDIALKYFGPRETRKGASAAPFGRRKVFPGSFMKAGWLWGKRIVKPNWNGQVFERTGGKTKSGMDKFEKVKSGVIIPQEMVIGETRRAFSGSVARLLPQRIEHEIRRATNGVVS